MGGMLSGFRKEQRGGCQEVRNRGILVRVDAPFKPAESGLHP